MIKIRLARGGVKNDPFYRIVAIEHTRKMGGKPLALLGHWYPKNGDKKIDMKALKMWIDRGAKPSKAVESLIS